MIERWERERAENVKPDKPKGAEKALHSQQKKPKDKKEEKKGGGKKGEKKEERGKREE